MALYDHNEHWIRLWTRYPIASVQLEKIRDQVHLLPSNRDYIQVALMFTPSVRRFSRSVPFLLTAYTSALIFTAVLGLVLLL